MIDSEFSSTDKLTALAKIYGCPSLSSLISYVKKIPYGRNASRTDFSLVFTNNRGTCSTKHALVKQIAAQNDLAEVKLVLVMYKMHQANTPGIGAAIYEAGLEYIPEAHCYIQIGSQKVDLTNEDSDLSRIEDDVLEEQYINAEQVGKYKIDFHQQYLKNWLSDSNLTVTFEELWLLREKCIAALSVAD